MTTYTAKAGAVEHGWYVVDAQDKVLGRLAWRKAVQQRAQFVILKISPQAVAAEQEGVADAQFACFTDREPRLAADPQRAH